MGGDQVNIGQINTTLERPKSQIEIWMDKLADEVRTNQQAQQMVDSLQYYHKKHSFDGIDGLENKLDHAGRSHQKGIALRKKELFSKKLDHYSFYGAAQEIFAYFLAAIEENFNTYVHPFIGTLTAAEIDIAVKEKVVDPILAEMSGGGGVMMINCNHVSGMVYWLAEQCYVRWHK